jgi:lipopolysaccharide transport system ATP-binding protein
MSAMLHIEDVGKKFKLMGAAPYLSLREVVTAGFKKTGKPARSNEEFWALHDINLDIEKGERVGIIGRNGAGKSTLLKIISRITPPTTGRITIEGRVASLLEVGTGFHPELSGRENIYFNGSILGLKKKEIDQKLHEIIDFSGIEKFIDSPLKHYSSGMQLRLAFSVAAHLEPEILLIDEVLAVGDMEFQKKCIGKMEEVSRSDGRTILFVSHNMSYISSLCNKAVLLDKGTIAQTGPVNEVINGYMDLVRQTSLEATGDNNKKKIATLLSVKTVDTNGIVKDNFSVTETIGIKMDYEVLESGHVLWLGHNIHNEAGVNVFDTHSVNTEQYTQPHTPGRYSATAWIPANLLNTGNYFISTAIFNHLEHVIHLHQKDVFLFHVHDVFDTITARGKSPGDFPGVVRPLLNWAINQSE